MTARTEHPTRRDRAVQGLSLLPLCAQVAVVALVRPLPEEIPLQMNDAGPIWSAPSGPALIVTLLVGALAWLALATGIVRASAAAVTACTLTAVIAPTLWCIGALTALAGPEIDSARFWGAGALIFAVLFALVLRRSSR